MSFCRGLAWLCSVLLWGCTPHGSRPPVATATPRGEQPKAPLVLARPAKPPELVGRRDLSKMDSVRLEALMQEWYQRGEFAHAAVAGQWSVARGGDGRYDLACCLALSGEREGAFFYLQEAAIVEGVDARHAQSDPDLQMLRQDPRWARVASFLNEMGRYWEAHPVLKTTLILPRNYKPDRPIGVVIGLHGLGGNHNFVSADYQPLSDQLGIAFLGVSGTNALGPKAFRWSEEVARDQGQVSKALDSRKKELRVDGSRKILFGFSQGAKMAFELAATYPGHYRGAICFSPGGLTEDAARPNTHSLASQRYLFAVGDGENESTLKYARQGAAWCQQLGAGVNLRIYPGVSTHGFPSDFWEAFPNWLRWVDQRRADKVR